MPVLDGVRGAAILMVLVAHAVGLPLGKATTAIDVGAHAIARIGWTSIILFFVLSGYLITGILLDTKGERRWWPNFFARRALRIFPLYYGVLVGLFVVLPRLVHSSSADWVTLQANQAWYWSYLVNVLNWLTQGNGTPLHTGHFWSLAVEEQFYLVWPLAVWLCRPRTLLRAAVAVVLFGLVARILVAPMRLLDDPASGMSALQTAGLVTGLILSPLDGLMAGSALAVLARMEGGLARFRHPARWVMGGGVLLLLALAAWRGTLEYQDSAVFVIGIPLIAMVYAGVIVTAVTAPPGGLLHRVLGAEWIRNWGTYSYGIYVFHYPIMGALESQLSFVSSGFAWMGGARLPGALAFAVLVAAISYAVAFASYHGYEKHFLALKRHFERAKTPAALHSIPRAA